MRISSLAAASLLALAVSAGPAGAQPSGASIPPAPTGEFTLRRVLLSTGGVGYFEYETQVQGDAQLRFRVRLDQVDDVLKSVVVYDDQGTVGTITLPGQEPLRERFRGLPFPPEALFSPPQLLEALRGAEIRVTGQRELTGRVMSVQPETQRLADGTTIVRHRVTLLSAAGIQQFMLEDVVSLTFTNPVLAAQIDAALAAWVQYDDAQNRVLTAQISGPGERTVRLAYVVEAPLWKASYRLTLSSDPHSLTADLHGWAVLENLSGERWDRIELSVTSGNPVTLRQAIYDAYYVDRPLVPVEVLGRVLPLPDTGGIQYEMLDRAAPGATGQTRSVPLGGAAMPPPAPPPATAPLLAAQATEAATQVVFRVPQPVTLAAGESMLVPIVSRAVAAQRLSLYQPDTHPRHPLASVRLVNETGTGLPPGILTLYERDAATQAVSYVGDAQLSALPAGESRLVSFALDQKVTVDRSELATQTLVSARIVNGVLESTVRDRRTTQYRIAGAALEDRLLLIEHARLTGWELAGAGAGIELTASHYRIPVQVPAGTTQQLDVTLERVRLERVQLVSTNVNSLLALSVDGQLSAEVRAAIASLATMRQEIAALDQQLLAAERSRTTIFADQQRLRENLNAVPANSELARRYLDTLLAQEDQLAELTQQIALLQTAKRDAEAQLAAYLAGLTL